MPKIETLDINWAREQFPALKNKTVFMDNAGGSQILSSVIDRISHYLTNYNVQLGASYSVSQAASEELDKAIEITAQWINANHVNEVIIGPSSTMLLRILSICLSQQWQSGDEIIITNSDHEANMAPWKDLARQGLVIKTWKINPKSMQFEINDLQKLITKKTKLLAMTHASNILGSINPVNEIAQFVHDRNVMICVDGVAFAPHRLIDVKALDVDFYVFSLYKSFGPHLALMYGKQELLENMPGINHDFIQSVPYKFQPGNLNYELSYSLPAIVDYINQLASIHDSASDTQGMRERLAKGYDLIAKHEQLLVSKLLDYLNTNDAITIIGENTADKNIRVSTLSFIHENLASDTIVRQMDKHDIGIRFGDFYAVQLIDDLGLRDKNGVVRVSLVHYNTVEEVDRLIAGFKDIL